MKKYIIIRTKFFDKNKIRFNKSAIDTFSSRIEINELVKKIKFLLDRDFNGVINIGSERLSDYKAYKKYKISLKPCKRIEIIKNLQVVLPKDCSMNIRLLKKLKSRL